MGLRDRNLRLERGGLSAPKARFRDHKFSTFEFDVSSVSSSAGSVHRRHPLDEIFVLYFTFWNR